MKFELQQIFQKYSISNFMKIRQLGAELFHVDGQNDKLMDRQSGRLT